MLGEHKKKFVFVAYGSPGPSEMVSIVHAIIKAAGMTLARGFRVDMYPYHEKGGEGYTFFQPLCESYCVADVYYDLNETEVLISTCKPERMDTAKILEIMEIMIGPAVLT